MSNYSRKFSPRPKMRTHLLNEFLKALQEDNLPLVTTPGKHGHQIYNIPAAFDIEATNTYTPDGQKFACMYLWSFRIANYTLYGRTWQEFIDACDALYIVLDLSVYKRLYVFIHNLSYEFQFFRHYFDWAEVFSLDEREPIRALTMRGIEFRCSFLLSGYSLAKLGDNLTKYKVKKLVGDLNYTRIRHSLTEIKPAELEYSFADVDVVVCYIEECIEHDKGIHRLPMTKTGRVRKAMWRTCIKSKNFKEYKQMINRLTLDPAEYMQLKRAFTGGYTHAAALWSGKDIKAEKYGSITSYDFTSSYPAVMLSERFPMSRAEYIPRLSIAEFDTLSKTRLLIFEVAFTNFRYVRPIDSVISSSRCYHLVNAIVDNGRVFEADELATTVTNIDFDVIRGMCAWDECVIRNVRAYKPGYLPKAIIDTILDLYERKTQLKGVTGREAEYINGKENLNASYGMIVTDIVRDIVEYDGEWIKAKPDLEEEIQKYNRKLNRFLFYPWGVFVTAYARRNLFSAIVELGPDYLYSDTDSVKFLNYEKHKDYFEKYNKMITRKIETCLTRYGIDPERARPRTIKGEVKQLGVWDLDGEYTRFKTLGAKRYMTQDLRGHVDMTVAGLAKGRGLNYRTVGDPFDRFTDDMTVPACASNRLTHTYIDCYRDCDVTDYNGVTCHMAEMSSVHLEPAEYTLGMAAEYLRFLQGCDYR